MNSPEIDTEYLDQVLEEPEMPPEEPERIRQRIVIQDMSYHMRPLPPREWGTEGLTGVGDVILLAAWTGSGKTWIAYFWAVCIALARQFLGFNTVQGTCLIVNEEMNEYDLSMRLAMCNRANFGDESTPVKTISFARFNLFSDKTRDVDAALLEGAIDETGAKFVIIDSLSDIMQGGDENAVKDTQPVFMVLSDIAKRTRSVILVIHHTGKNGTTRGSSAIPGAVDLAIIAKRSSDGDRIDFETEKARIVPNLKWSAKMTWTEDQFYIERIEKPGADVLTGKEQAILAYLENKPATTKEIETETGVSRWDVINLATKGKIQRIDGGGQGKAATWGLVVVGTCENLL
jgi:RecA-family ATPase